MRRVMLAGNWKMHKTKKDTLSFFDVFLKEIAPLSNQPDLLFACPFTSLEAAKKAVGNTTIDIAAQNVHFEDQGAFTGETSIPMLQELGIKHVIIGHSERRQYFNESDESVTRKVFSCLTNAMTPIVCVGETKEQRERDETTAVIKRQVEAFISELDSPKELIVAYEPIWAIGTGLTATAEQAQQVHRFIRDLFESRFGSAVAQNLRILYGGSAKPENIAALVAQEDIDGALVGGASLKPETFSEMVKQVCSH